MSNGHPMTIEEAVAAGCDQITARVADAFERGALVGLLRILPAAPPPTEQQSLDALRQRLRQALPAAPAANGDEPEPKRRGKA